MSDNKPIQPIELKWTFHKDGECLDCAEIDRKVRTVIFKAFQIPDALLVDGDKPRPPIDTSVLRESFSVSLAVNQIDEQFFNDLLNPQVRFESQLRRAILEAIQQAGCHPENVERVEFALRHPVGNAAMLKLTVDECKDVEHLVQKFLKIYRDITA